MKDLESRKDVELLVDQFYLKVKNDDLIGFFFTEIADVNWDLHLPKMYSFWETLLLPIHTYNGNTMAKHFPINEKSAMEKKHFDRWFLIWTQTVDENFKGETAESAKVKARNIAGLMAFKMEKARL